MTDLATRIREKREREGLSLRDVGEASGVAFSTLGRVENGGMTTVRVAQKIEAWLNGEAPILPTPPMTLRDWFAGQALSGLASATDNTGTWQTIGAEINAAVAAYQFADAMLAERAKAIGGAQ